MCQGCQWLECQTCQDRVSRGVRACLVCFYGVRADERLVLVFDFRPGAEARAMSFGTPLTIPLQLKSAIFKLTGGLRMRRVVRPR